jgi:hypothetical protein
MRKKGSVVLTVTLADNSCAHIPAEWTDLNQQSVAEGPRLLEAIGSLADLLRCRNVVDHLLGRMKQ